MPSSLVLMLLFGFFAIQQTWANSSQNFLLFFRVEVGPIDDFLEGSPAPRAIGVLIQDTNVGTRRGNVFFCGVHGPFYPQQHLNSLQPPRNGLVVVEEEVDEVNPRQEEGDQEKRKRGAGEGGAIVKLNVAGNI